MPDQLSISRSAKNDTEGVTNHIESENFAQQLAAQLTRLFHVESKASRVFEEIIRREQTDDTCEMSEDQRTLQGVV